MSRQGTEDHESSENSGNREANGAGSEERGVVLSVIGLVVSVSAIGLASIPSLALDRPILNPFGEVGDNKPLVETPPEREGGVTFKFRDLSVNFGGKVPEDELAAQNAPAAVLTKDPVRWFSVSAIASALVGLVLATVAHVRERHTAFAVGSMGCCAAAITWQYLAIGIAVGVGAAVFLFVLGSLGAAGAS